MLWLVVGAMNETLVRRRGRRFRRGRMRAGLLTLVLLAPLTVVLLRPASAASVAAVSDAVETPTPALSSLSPGRIDVFTRSSAGTLQYRYLLPGGSWTDTRDLGGALASQPSVVSWAQGRFDVFARGTNGALVHRWFNVGSGWSAWENLGGSLRSAPSAVSEGSGNLKVFARSSDDALWYRSYVSGSGWSPWLRIGGVLTASPSAATWAPGRVDVFVRATDGSLRHAWWTGGPWSPFENLGGFLTSQPAAASPGPDQLDIAVRATDNTMRIKSFSRPTRWSAFVNRGGIFTSGPGALALAGDLLVTGRGTTGAVYTGRRTAGAWTAWQVLDVYLPVRRLATWVDTLDYGSLDPATAIGQMKTDGVRTLYLGTGRFNSPSDFFDATKAGQFLDQAHRAGIKVVGWYVPAYGDMARDVRRTVAIATFVSPGGQRFDAVGVDIERYGTDGEVSQATFNTRLVDHLQQVRDASAALLVAIVPPPFATFPSAQFPHPRWEGFPWSAVGQRSDVVEPMTMWTNRRTDSGQPFSATDVYNWTKDQITRTVNLTGKPVAVEGGIGSDTTTNTPATLDRLNRFVDAVIDTRSLGGSHYDFLTTTGSGFWPALARLNGL